MQKHVGIREKPILCASIERKKLDSFYLINFTLCGPANFHPKFNNLTFFKFTTRTAHTAQGDSQHKGDTDPNFDRIFDKFRQ